MRKSHRRYLILAELTPLICIVRIDLTYKRWLDANQTAMRFFGIPRAELIGDEIWQVIHPDDEQIVEEKLTNLAEEHPNATFISRVLFNDGNYREVEWNVSLFTQEDTSSEAIAVFMDITERKKDEQLRLEREKLRGVLEMAGAAAHEFNQPLQAVIGLFWVLKRKKYSQADEGQLFEKFEAELNKIALLGRKVAQISRYAVKPYAGNTHIIDIEKASADSRGELFEDGGEK